LKPGQLLILHGKAEVDKLRPARLEMINPQIEVLSNEEMDSTRSAESLPIYEAITHSVPGRFAVPCTPRFSLSIRDAGYFAGRICARGLAIRSRRSSDSHGTFPEPGESHRCLEHVSFTIAAAAHLRGIFPVPASLAWDRKATRKKTPSRSVCGEDAVREALKRILPFKPNGGAEARSRRNRCGLGKTCPMNRPAQGDVGSGKTIIALQAAVIAIENGTQAALMAPTEILAVQHFLSARRILAKAGYRSNC